MDAIVRAVAGHSRLGELKSTDRERRVPVRVRMQSSGVAWLIATKRKPVRTLEVAPTRASLPRDSASWS